MEGGEDLEHTPTWAVSILCLFFLLLSFTIDAGLHHLAKFLRKRKRKSLDKALVKIKTEMMNFGFISLLLTILEVPISKICVTEAAANSFLPCKDTVDSANVAEGSNFNFKKFLSRAFDDDFEQVVGIRYISLPTYNKVVERVVRGLENWQKNARERLSKNRSNSSRHSSNSSQFNTAVTSISSTQSKHLPEHDDHPPLAVISPSSYSPGNTEEEVQHGQTPNPAITSVEVSTQEIMKEEANRTIITTGTYDGEISFGSSWKARESSRGIGEITSITEEDASDTLTVFNHRDVDNDLK